VCAVHRRLSAFDGVPVDVLLAWHKGTVHELLCAEHMPAVPARNHLPQRQLLRLGAEELLPADNGEHLRRLSAELRSLQRGMRLFQYNSHFELIKHHRQLRVLQLSPHPVPYLL